MLDAHVINAHRAEIVLITHSIVDKKLDAHTGSSGNGGRNLQSKVTIKYLDAQLAPLPDNVAD